MFERAEKITSAKKCRRDTMIMLFTSAIMSAFAECRCELERLDIVHDRHNFCHFGPFFALLPSNNQKNQNFEKMKKHLEILSFYTCAP